MADDDARAPAPATPRPTPLRPRRGLGPVYIVLPPAESALGGAEKRLIGMWLHIARRGAADVRLVINEALLPLLRSVDEFSDLPAYQDRILTVRGARLTALKLHAVLRAAVARDAGAVFHLVITTPGILAPMRRSRTMFTLAAASLTNFNRRGLLDILVGCLRVSRIDVLDADVGRALGALLPMKRGAISVTPGSFVDLERFAPLPAREKTNRLVFLGTFIRNKQVFRLLDQVPQLHAALVARGFRDVSFEFLGRDSVGEPSATQIVARLAERLPVRAFYAARPSDVLRASKVFFSVQRLENYPSKALLEAMACGCLPIVTDVGKSRQVARDEFAWFVPGEFSPADLVEACTQILSQAPDQFDARVARAREFLGERFGVDTMTNYYLDLYERLAREA